MNQGLAWCDEQARTGPSAAEAARTVLANASSVRVDRTDSTTELGRHAMLQDGTIVFVPPAAAAADLTPLVRTSAPLRVVAQDVAPVAVADRVRGTVTMVAHLSAHPDPLPLGARAHLLVPGERDEGQPVLALTPRRMRVRLHLAGAATAAVPVAVADYRCAWPDPLIEHEEAWLGHIDHGHADVLDALATAVAPGRRVGPVRAVRLTQYGLGLRVGSPGRDIHVPFAEPARCGCDLPGAFAELLARLLPDGPAMGCGA